MRQFAGQSEFTHYRVGKWVCAKQVVMPGPADRDFLRGSGQASPNVMPSPFASVTVVLWAPMTRTPGINSEELQKLLSCPDCNTGQDTSEMCCDKKDIVFLQYMAL